MPRSCLKLVDLLATHPHVKRAVVFCDSKIAIDACERPKKRPKNLANAALTRALRKAIDFARLKLDISLLWIKGHATVGGNERADLISKRFASVRGNTDVLDFSDSFDCQVSLSLHLLATFLPLDFLPSDAIEVDTCSARVNRARGTGPRSRTASIATRRSARLASLREPVPQFVPLILNAPVSLSNGGEELDYKHGD